MKPLIALLSALACAPALADDASMRQCRRIADPGARLACYDAVPVAAAPAAAPAAPAPVPPPPAAVAVLPATASPAANFGLERRAGEPDAIVSSITGSFEGWGPRQRIRLANGQVWQVVDDSTGVYALRDPKVTIKRAFMGGFVMEIDGANLTPRVRRIE